MKKFVCKNLRRRTACLILLVLIIVITNALFYISKEDQNKNLTTNSSEIIFDELLADTFADAAGIEASKEVKKQMLAVYYYIVEKDQPDSMMRYLEGQSSIENKSKSKLQSVVWLSVEPGADGNTSMEVELYYGTPSSDFLYVSPEQDQAVQMPYAVSGSDGKVSSSNHSESQAPSVQAWRQKACYIVTPDCLVKEVL